LREREKAAIVPNAAADYDFMGSILNTNCAFSGDPLGCAMNFIHCVLINYPAGEEKPWDAIVTHISLSLSGR